MRQYINKRKIVLASGSPRRKSLLEEAGFDIEVMPLDIDETFSEEIPLELVAEHLANRKADAGLHLIADNKILLAADSVVVLGDRIFNKPADFNDAYRMLSFLSGKRHTVYTGVCVADHQRRMSFTGVSQVYMRELIDAEVRWYIEQYKPYDKAGSYAVQEWIGLCKISAIEGSYANIMGLPTDLVYEAIRHFDDALSIG
ncbi:MAG TPA: Maf family protein [Saprospiraceae bacterium]|nr:Maf family protein [Saprospiraceae bacterium]HMX87022.1 Maf family protein [Saprospiraceae bacterium]HMZ39799.1 Maf family protein [Saprospiraceae bacterium]HNA63531.1 Maf family protein [Saprospiraceae bacterium]HNB30374.1 Maf family protein [Saprospiraceae bacterium]